MFSIVKIVQELLFQSDKGSLLLCAAVVTVEALLESFSCLISYNVSGQKVEYQTGYRYIHKGRYL